MSFPYISAHTTRVSIPRVLFFVGKHFGTGVILSTAFVHLLQDAFKSLNSHHVRRISKIGDWTGLIVWVCCHTLRRTADLGLQAWFPPDYIRHRVYVPTFWDSFVTHPSPQTYPPPMSPGWIRNITTTTDMRMTWKRLSLHIPRIHIMPANARRPLNPMNAPPS